MAISYVNSAQTTTGVTTATTLTITDTPTTGNIVIVALTVGSQQMPGAGASGVTCQDNNGNLLAAGPSIVWLNSMGWYYFYGTAIVGATSYTCNWTTAVWATMIFGEYAGAYAVNPHLPGNTTTGTAEQSVTISINVNTTGPNNWIVCLLGDSIDILTADVGNQRQNVGTSIGQAQMFMDNTVASAGSLSCSATMNNAGRADPWIAMALELLSGEEDIVNLAGNYDINIS